MRLLDGAYVERGLGGLVALERRQHALDARVLLDVEVQLLAERLHERHLLLHNAHERHDEYDALAAHEQAVEHEELGDERLAATRRRHVEQIGELAAAFAHRSLVALVHVAEQLVLPLVQAADVAQLLEQLSTLLRQAIEGARARIVHAHCRRLRAANAAAA